VCVHRDKGIMVSAWKITMHWIMWWNKTAVNMWKWAQFAQTLLNEWATSLSQCSLVGLCV
jgi:hypothetical protein